MKLRFHEIAESNHRVHNPMREEKLGWVVDICAPYADMRVLDLACGTGEFLVQLATKTGIKGEGIDISEVFLKAARQRAVEMEVHEQLTFTLGDASEALSGTPDYDLVSCIGATWIGGGLVGTLNGMKSRLRTKEGLMVIGEPYWNHPPSAEVCAARQTTPEEFATLAGMLDRFESVRLTLVEMVLAGTDDWDRFAAPQWRAVDTFLRHHPDDPDTEELRAWNAKWKRINLTWDRDWFGWGIFVLRPRNEV